MDIAILGVNVPAPPISVKKELLEEYARLYKGIRSREDPVTWRTFIISTKKILNVENPDFKPVPKKNSIRAKRLVKTLVKGTYMERLVPEIMYALGLRNAGGRCPEPLDFLLVNGRHYTESSLWNLANYIKSKNKKVAVVNPVGHYNDGQTRVLGPGRLLRKIDRLVIFASTQTKHGGSISVLSNVLRIIRNPDFASHIKVVDVVIPMFGGSRGHRIGQSEKIGFEIIEAGFNAKLLSLPARDLLNKLKKEIQKIPVVRFFSVDVHNNTYPEKVFKEEGFDFTSIDPSCEFADEIIKIIKGKRLTKLPLRIIVCDKGVVVRAECLTKQILKLSKRTIKDVQVIYLSKKRPEAGVVSSVEISKIERWQMFNKKIKKRFLRIPTKPTLSRSIFVYSDDMIDTGGTAKKDMEFLSTIFPNTTLKIFAATHPVFSKGFLAIKNIGADLYILGNTLNYNGLSELKGVSIIDLSASIYREISK